MSAGNLTHIHRGVTHFLVALITLLSASSMGVRAVPAYTEVGGPIISDTTWTLANSPYIATSNVQVMTGVTLTIEAGVVVKFNKDKLLQVDGTLIARGTINEPITFTSNQVSPAKGDWGNITFTDSSVDATFDAVGNYTGGSILEYCVVEYGGNGVDGAVQTDQASPLIDHCTVRNNDSSGVYAVGTNSTPVVIRDNTVSHNSATGDHTIYGGGIYVSYGTVTGNIVSDNSATVTGDNNVYGGGIYASYGTVTSNTVSSNSAKVTDDNSVYGGGIYASYGIVTGNTVSSNSVKVTVDYDGDNHKSGGYGGGIYVVGSTVTGNSVRGNVVEVMSDNYYDVGHFSYGGGIYAGASTVTDNTVSGNRVTAPRFMVYGGANSHGGGIYAEGSTVMSNTVSGNLASDNDYYPLGDGGGISAISSTVTSNAVSSNAAGGGGGIYVESSTVTGNTISGNLSTYSGGGIDVESSSTVTGNTISGNSSTDRGGGIHAGGSSTVRGNIVSGNSAVHCELRSSGDGGGIYAEDSTVAENTISGNSAGGCLGGGGIYAAGSVVTGNIVSGNSAASDGYDHGSFGGGGIYATDSTMTSNTVTSNSLSAATGQGSGVYFRGSADFLYNTVIDNTAISPAALIGGVTIDGTPQFHYNNLYGNSNYDVVVLSSGDISGTHNYWGTVATVDILAHVYDWNDDSARGKLLYVPYLQDPDPNAPVPPPQNLRATFAGGSASLSWDAIPSTTTGYGYKVYYDTDRSGPPYHGAGAAEGDSPIDVGNVTHFTLSGLEGHIYIAVTAYDTQGRESWYSNEAISQWRAYLPTVLKR